MKVMIAHSCIKPGCDTKYQSEDVDAYYCEVHDAERKAIAAEIDKKVRPSKSVKSDLQIFDEVAKTQVFPNGRTVSFARASDLGL